MLGTEKPSPTPYRDDEVEVLLERLFFLCCDLLANADVEAEEAVGWDARIDDEEDIDAEVEADVDVEAEDMDEPVMELAKDGPRGLVIAMGIEESLGRVGK